VTELHRLGGGAVYPSCVIAHGRHFLEGTLAQRERWVVERLLGRLRRELGEDLLAVWLYGSRARGEADPTETDPDRRSDVDLLAIVDPSRDVRAAAWWALPMVEEEADAVGDSPVYYSLRIFDTVWLRERREVRSFFVQEVDRDKLVLYGDTLEELGDRRSVA
jgi:predicted nucleotidyltransferase